MFVEYIGYECLICLYFFFFFSSRRRHTRFDCDWSSDVCSSDLRDRLRVLRASASGVRSGDPGRPALASATAVFPAPARSEERRVGKSVDLGGRRNIKKKKQKTNRQHSSKMNNKQNESGLQSLK